jgi:hypothetical protein
MRSDQSDIGYKTFESLVPVYFSLLCLSSQKQVRLLQMVENNINYNFPISLLIGIVEDWNTVKIK